MDVQKTVVYGGVGLSGQNMKDEILLSFIRAAAAKIAHPAISLSALASLVILLCPFMLAQAQDRTSNGARNSNQRNEGRQSIEGRGKYIVEDLARCTQCHTPRDEHGNLDRNKWLEGAPLWLQPARPVQDWPLQAPRIAGDPPGTDAEMVRLLTTGIWKDGKQLREPMPQFRMSTADAEAVVAYLKSLTPQH